MEKAYHLMNRTGRRVLAFAVAFIFLLTTIHLPAEAAEATQVALMTTEITAETTAVEIHITGKPDAGILRVVEMEAGEVYDSAKLNDYTSLNFSLLANLQEGSNTLELTGTPAEGRQILVVLRDSSGDITDYCSEGVIVQAAEQPEPVTDAQIAINGSVSTTASEIPVLISGDLPGECVVSVRGYISSYTDIDYSSPWQGNGDYNFNIGSNVSATVETTSVAVSGRDYLAEGMQLVAYLLYDGEVLAHSDISLVQGSGSLVERANAILQNCSVTLIHDEDITMDETGIEVQVALDEAVESCSLTIYELPQNIAFDSDTAAYFTSLWSGTVTDGYHETISFREGQLPLKAYHKLVAVLNIPIDTSGDGYYRTKESSPVYVLDEDGNRFTDYEYPDVSIDEETLEAGATSLHISLTGDERLFRAVQSGDYPDFQIVYSVAMYPEGEEFDFEGENQVGLVNYQQVTEPFSGKEITFTEPLREGYRVRAVVYWTQEEDLFVAKGNDYEAMFGKPDDSVPVTAVSTDPKISIEGDVRPQAESVSLQITGELPEGTMCSVKSFPAGTDSSQIAYDKGTAQAFLTSVEAGTTSVTLREPSELTEGTILTAFLLSGGSPIAQSAPAAVQKAPAPTVAIKGKITTESENISVELEGEVPAGARLILFTFPADATEFPRDYNVGSFLATLAEGVAAGSNTVAVEPEKLEAGLQVVAFLLDGSFNDISSSGPVSVVDPSEELTVSLGSVTTSDETVEVTISGSLPEGAMILVKSYSADTTEFAYDKGEPHGVTAAADTHEGVVTHTLTNTEKLTKGRKLVAFILAGGGAAAASEPVEITQGAYSTPAVAITDKEITAGDTRLNFSASFDRAISSASYTVYSYTADTFDKASATELVSGTLTISSEKTAYVAGKIQAGDKLVVVLTVLGEDTVSEPVVVGPSPDWGTPAASFTVESVKDDAAVIPVHIDYAEEYTAMEDFYCDVTVYMFDKAIDDDIFEEDEYWEKYDKVSVVAKANSTLGDATRGDLSIPVRSGAELEAGKKLIIKLRLPHTEWEGEEVDYLSASVLVTPASEFMQGPSALLYNVDPNSARGAKIVKLLERNNIAYKIVTDADLNETIGYLIEKKGFEKAAEPYTGAGFTSEFMLMNADDYDVWDQAFYADGALIDQMRDNGVSIAHKAKNTATNEAWTLEEMIRQIAEEHEVMTGWIALNKLAENAAGYSEETYGSSENWAEFQEALAAAQELLKADEEELSGEALTEAYEKLSEQMQGLTAAEDYTSARKEELSALAEQAAAYTEAKYGYSLNWEAFAKAQAAAEALLQEEDPGAGALELAAQNLSAEMASLTPNADNVENAEITLPADTYTYNGKVRKPAPTVVLNGTQLVKGTDYTVSYADNTNAGRAAVTITGKGDYTGEAVTYFTIAAKAVTPAVTLSTAKYTYSGKARKPSVTVKDGSTELVKGSDYSVSYDAGRTDAGTYKVKVKLKGNYSGSKTVSFTIAPKTITPTVTLSAVKYTYSGKVRKPAVTVKNGSKALVKGTDYTVSYASGRKDVGTYKVTVKLKGNYSGSKTVSFKILPKVPAAPSLKALAAGFTASWAKQTVQVSGCQIQYSTDKTFKTGSKTASVSKNTVVSKKITGLKSGKTYYVRVRNFMTVDGSKYYSGWSAAKAVKTK